MSKRKQENQDFDDFDDFDFDSEFNFDADGGFDAESSPKGRNPVTRFVGGFVNGVKESLFTRDTVTKLVDGALPHSYQVVLDGALDTASELRDTVDKSYSEVEKSVNRLRDGERESLNTIADALPKGAGEKLKNWANTSKAGYSGNQDQDSMAIGNDLAAVFGAATVSATSQQAQTMETVAESSVTQSKLLTGSNDLLFNINRSLEKLTQYQDTVGVSFQRKMLETSLHQLFVQRKHLERVNKHYDFIEKAVPNLIQNTGLPDFVKIQQSEMVRQEMANRFVGQISDSLYANSANIRNRIFRKMYGSIKEASDQISGMGGMMLSGLAQVLGPSFDGQKADPIRMFGSGISTYATKYATDFVGEQVKDMIKSSPELQKKIGDGDHLLQMMRARMPGYMNDSLLKGRTGIGVIDGIAEFTRLNDLSLRRKDKIQNGLFKHLNDPAVFTLRTQRAITEVIPGLLSRIHLEVYRANGGKAASPIQFDWDRGGFTTTKDYTSKLINDKVATANRAKEIVETDNNLLSKIDPDNELSGKSRNKIANYVMMAGIKGEDVSLSHFIDPGSKLYIKEVAEHFKRKYNFEMERDESKNIAKVLKKFAKQDRVVTDIERHIAESRNRSAQQFDDPLRELIDIAGKMDISELANYDFIKVGKDGSYAIDYEKYLNYQRRHAANIEGTKLRRAPYGGKKDSWDILGVTNMFDRQFRFAGANTDRPNTKITSGGTPSYWREDSNRVVRNLREDELGVVFSKPSTISNQASASPVYTYTTDGNYGFEYNNKETGYTPGYRTHDSVNPNFADLNQSTREKGTTKDLFGLFKDNISKLVNVAPTVTNQSPQIIPTPYAPVRNNPQTPVDTVNSVSETPPGTQQKPTMWEVAKHKFSNVYTKSALGMGGILAPTVAGATTMMGDMALNGVTVADGGTLALVAGGAAGVTYLANKFGGKLKETSPTNLIDDDEDSALTRRQRKKRDKTRTQTIAGFSDKAFEKTERLLDFILKRNTEGFNQLHEDFGLIINTLKEMAVSGAINLDFRAKFLSDIWGKTKTVGKSIWDKGGNVLKWNSGILKWGWNKAKWVKDKVKDKQHVLSDISRKAWKGAKWTATAPWDFAKHLLGNKENPGTVRRGWSKLKQWGTSALDMATSWKDGIYLQGEDFPRLDAIGLRTGKYRDEATGKVIRKLSDITGNVIDENGVIVLTKDQLLQGLYDRHGRKLGEITSRLKGLYDVTIGLGKSTASFLLSLPFRAAGWMFGKAKDLKDRLDKYKKDKNWGELLKFGAFTNSGKQLEELVRIREFLEKRFKDDIVWGDNDGDGDKDGSLSDILDERNKQKEKGEEEKKAKKKDGDKEDKKGIFGKLFGSLSSKLLPFLGAALTGLGTVMASAIPALLAKVAIPKIANYFSGNTANHATDANDPRLDPNSPHYNPNVFQPTTTQKVAGWVGDKFTDMPWWGQLAAGYGAWKLGSMAVTKGVPALIKGGWAGGKWLVTGGVSKLATGATMLARTGLLAKSLALGKGALTLGASLMASPLAPVVGAVAAAAVVGYAGYKLWKRYKKNDNPMLRLRMAGYGYDVQDEDHVPKLLEVEILLQKYLRKKNDGTYTLDRSLTRESIYPLFNVNPEDVEQKTNWEKYFYYRFLPVFITFVNCLVKLKDVPIDVTKMDDNLSYQQMLTVCNDSMISKKELNPYSVLESGFSGERKVDLDQEEVFDIYDSVKKLLDKNVRKGKVNKRQQQRTAENAKLDKEIKREDKKLSDLLTRHGYNADAILKNPVSRLFGENVVTKVLDKVTNSITSPIRAVGRMGEFVANKIGLSDSLAGTPAASKGGVGGFFSGLLDSFLGRGGRPMPQQYPTGGMSGAGVGGDMSGKPGIAPKNTIDFAKSFTKGLRIGNLTETQTAALAANTAQTESQFRQDIVNEYGYTGLYQFGGQALADIGFMKNIGAKSTSGWNNAMKNPSNWNNGLTLEKFKASREIQDKAYVALANKNIQYGMGAAKGDKAKFQSAINDYRQLAKFLKMAHLKGAGNAVKGLLYGKDARDGNGTSMISYGNGAARNVDSILAALGGANATISSTNTTQATTSASVSSSVNKSAAASNPVGVGVLKPDANISYKDAKIDKMKQATSGDTKIMNDIGVPLPQTKEDNAKSPISGDSQPARAARIARSRAGKKSQHRCSMYVRIALQKAGYPLRHPPSAYQNHTDNRLKEAGFVQIHVGTRWQIGDVLVVNRTKNNVHGHIQIWDGSNWISDFIQNKIVKYRDGDGFALYRDKNYLNGAIPYNGGWQPYALITGSNGSTSLPASGATGPALGPIGVASSGKKFTKRDITSMDEIHGRIKTDGKKITEDKKEKVAPTKKDTALGKDDKGKKQAEKLAKDTAVTVSKKAEATKITESSTKATKPPEPTVSKQNSKNIANKETSSSKTILPPPKEEVKPTKVDRTKEYQPVGVKSAAEDVRKQRQRDEEAKQQAIRNEHMLRIMSEDKNILEKQLSVQLSMLNELKVISQSIKNLQIASPVPATQQEVNKPVEPMRPPAPETIVEPVSMLKS